MTRPVEVALRSIPGVRSVESTTSRGTAEVSITFDWGQDMTTAYLQTQSQIAQVSPTLPRGLTFEMRRMDPTVFQSSPTASHRKTRSPSELRTLAQLQLLPALSKIEGVARVSVDGGEIEEIHVEVDPAKLASLDLAVSDLSAALAAANVITAVGHIEENSRLYLVIVNDSTQTLESIRQLVIKSTPRGAVRVADVAEVMLGKQPQFTHSSHDRRQRDRSGDLFITRNLPRYRLMGNRL